MSGKPAEFKSMRPDLFSGRPLYGWYVTFQLSDIVELVASHIDWVWIDLQHSPIDIDATLSIVRATEARGLYSLIRVGRNDPFLIGQALDLGASGVIVPLVDTPQDARRVVEAAKFPPEGRRSFGSRRLVGLYGYEYADHANEDTVVFVQLESALAFENAEAIAAVDGVDGLIFSPDDFIREKGLGVVVPRPPDLGAKEKQRIIAATRKHGKVAGCFCDNPASLETSLEMGYRLVVVAEEDTVILEGCARIFTWVGEIARKCKKEGPQ